MAGSAPLFRARGARLHRPIVKVSVLLGDEKRRREMGINARKKVEESFSVERVVDSLERLYRSVAKA